MMQNLQAAWIQRVESSPKPWPHNGSRLDPSAHSLRACATKVALVSHVSGPHWFQTSEPELSTDSFGPENLHRPSPQFSFNPGRTVGTMNPSGLRHAFGNEGACPRVYRAETRSGGDGSGGRQHRTWWIGREKRA